MCGIVGIFEYGRSEGRVDPALLERMRDVLAHRGPDGAGLHVSPDGRLGLGHRRLAIVDIEGGAQPMYGHDGDVLVFNGEIYNYPELRRELEAGGARFDTRCDTEVILRLYERHGEACVEHLNGMYAFAIWDPRREQLMLARDRIGEKPLYWTVQDGRLIFASEIKALLAHPSVRPRVNRGALASYLANLVVAPPETLFEGIYKLAPGELGICDADGIRVRRYWDLFDPRRFAQDGGPATGAKIRSMLERSVDARLMADVPVGVLLSGGLDSTTIVALLRDRARDLATFSVGFHDQPALDERAEARRVAAHFKTDHHEVVLSEADAIGFLERLVHHQDEPLADPVCLPLHFVCELARQNGVPVVLAGEGADELFWGYPRYRRSIGQWRWIEAAMSMPRPLRALARRAIPARIAPHRAEWLAGILDGRPLPAHFPLALGDFDRRRLLAGDLGDGPVRVWRRGTPVAGEDPLGQYAFDTQEYEFGLRLPELLLMRIDRFSMANSVEARVPFLDPDLVSYVYRLPLTQKLVAGETKVCLRAAISDIVPPWVLARRKQGFGAPVQAWMGSRLGDVLGSMLGDDTLRGYFRAGELEKMLRGAASGRHVWALWPILNFALWHRYWVEGEPLGDLLESALVA